MHRSDSNLKMPLPMSTMNKCDQDPEYFRDEVLSLETLSKVDSAKLTCLSRLLENLTRAMGFKNDLELI